MGSNMVDGLPLLIFEVSSERFIGEKQSRVRPEPEEVTETSESPTAVGGWAWLISSLISSLTCS